MSREIKFRAWDKLKKCWIKPSLNNFWLTTAYKKTSDSEIVNNKHFVLGIDLEKKDHGRFKEGGDADIQMFTGLKDKNGKEIYEGDIIKEWKSVDSIDVVPYDIYEIKFANGAFLVSNNHRGKLLMDHVNCEIIGNIYENPALVTKER